MTVELPSALPQRKTIPNEVPQEVAQHPEPQCRSCHRHQSPHRRGCVIRQCARSLVRLERAIPVAEKYPTGELPEIMSEYSRNAMSGVPSPLKSPINDHRWAHSCAGEPGTERSAPRPEIDRGVVPEMTAKSGALSRLKSRAKTRETPGAALIHRRCAVDSHVIIDSGIACRIGHAQISRMPGSRLAVGGRA